MFNSDLTRIMNTRLLVLFLVLLLAGCGRVSEKTVAGVLEKDPSFAQALKEKESAARKVEALKFSMKEARGKTNSEIGLLRKSLTVKKAEIKEKIRIQQIKITPLIDGLSAKLRQTQIEYDIAKDTLSERLEKLKSIRSLLLKKDKLTLSGDEIALWNRRTEDLDREINSLKNDLDRLSARIHLLKTEIKILRE